MTTPNFVTDVSSKNLDANERGYALIGKPEDMHTWFFLYDESMRAVDPVDNDHAHNYNVSYSSIGQRSRGGVADMSASISVPNLDQSEATPSNFNYNYNYGPVYHAHPHQHHQQQNFMMYGHAQSVQQPPPTPPMMDHGHAHHGGHCGGLSQHHSRSGLCFNFIPSTDS